MQTAEIRSTYLAHFANRGHRVVPSAPLIPGDDPTILFTVAGMVQFKDALTGTATLPYSRATSCQRCVRAGGKHNDLENVGYTARHHTFFEMLGNFSFGDYFKEEAIVWAWEYVRDVLRLPPEKFWFTVHPSDKEAHALWVKKIGIDPSRVVAHEDNFWAMGDTGPCGPCSEIFFDQGPAIDGGPPGSVNEDGDRYLEIWNLVFPQFDRAPDGTLDPLAKPGVDTGLGLERLAAVMQGVSSNYETDIFVPIFQSLAHIAKRSSVGDAIAESSCRVVADHVRSAAFLISDGILPDREGRGYVLRRIIRRALRHGYKLGIEEPFFHRLVAPLVESMGGAYPELNAAQERITNSLYDEELKFGETMKRGVDLLDAAMKALSGDSLGGDVAFKLYDTYGFPVDLTADIARENGITVDQVRFDQLMLAQQERARGAGQFQANTNADVTVDGAVEFVGYEKLAGGATVENVFVRYGEQLAETDVLSCKDVGALVLDKTVFYGEAGGQVGDTGVISSGESRFHVTNVTRSNEQFIHHGEVVSGSVVSSQSVNCEVDVVHRQDVARNHSATHLLHAALKVTLGDHVQQRGSLVEQDRLRFDFSHDRPLRKEERREIEESVNQQILSNAFVETRILPYDDAMKSGAVALFGEKYGDEVRVLTMGNGYSIELCGGTHVARTGEIGVFKITSETGIAAGTRRVEAVTGRKAYELFRRYETLLDDVGEQVSSSHDQLVKRVGQLLAERRDLQQKLDDVLSLNLRERGSELADSAVAVGDVELVKAVIEGNADAMMASFDDLRSRLSNYLVVLAITDGDKCQLVCGVSKSLTKRFGSQDVVTHLMKFVAIRGGGKPMMTRAGGAATHEQVEKAFATLADWVASRVNP